MSHHHTAHFRAGLNLDELETGSIAELQTELNIANTLSFQIQFPEMQARGKRMIAEVIQKVTAMIQAELKAI